jgi:hypothetical protein
VSQQPEPHENGLLRRREVREDLVGDVLHDGVVWRVTVGKSRERGKLRADNDAG